MNQARGGRRSPAPFELCLFAVSLAIAVTGYAALEAAEAEQASPVALPASAGDPGGAGALVAAPSGELIFSGEGGLFRSGDGGATWEQAGPPPPPGRLVVAADDPRLLLVGARPPCAKGEADPIVLHRSHDGGATWTNVAGAVDVEPLAVWSDAQLALGASCAGLLVSTDAGLTWPELPPSRPLMEPGYDVTAFAVIDGVDADSRAALVAGTSEGGTSQLRRLDLSDPSQPAASGALKTFWGRASLAGRDTDTGGLHVAGTARGVLVSADGGVTWTMGRAGLEAVTLSVDPEAEPIPAAEQERGYGIPAVAIDPIRDGRLFAGTIDGLFVSLDLGLTWRPVPGVDGTVRQIVLAPDAGRMLVQTDRAVLALPLDS